MASKTITNQLIMRCFFFFLCIPLSSSLLASEPAWLHPSGSLQIHGFATQAAMNSSHYNVFGKTQNDIGLDFSEIGLNVSWLAHPDLLFSTQTLYRKTGKTASDDRLKIDFASVNWTAYSGDSLHFNLNLGRVKNPFGFHNTTRDVAFTRSGAFLPQSIYPERIRTRMLSGDGLYLNADYDTENYGSFLLNSGFYLPRVSNAFTERALGKQGGTPQGEFDPSTTSWLTQLMWELNNGDIRFALTKGAGELDYEPGLNDTLNSGTFNFSPLVLSAQYNTASYSLTSEYALRHAKFTDFGPSHDREIYSDGWYFEGIYRLNSDWEFLLRNDLSYADRDDRNGEIYHNETGNPAFHRFTKDWTIGVKRNIGQHAMVRAEYHRLDGTFLIPAADNPDLVQTNSRWDLLVLLFSVHF